MVDGGRRMEKEGGGRREREEGGGGVREREKGRRGGEEERIYVHEVYCACQNIYIH